jgi:hypothetical protein
VSVWPCLAVPVIVGSVLELGGLSGLTVAVGLELALAVPSLLVAVTVTRTVKPTSAAVSV